VVGNRAAAIIVIFLLIKWADRRSSSARVNRLGDSWRSFFQLARA
jgi:hypothetical protein